MVYLYLKFLDLYYFAILKIYLLKIIPFIVLKKDWFFIYLIKILLLRVLLLKILFTSLLLINILERDITHKSINFLSEDIGLSKAAINLGIKLSMKNNASLPITLWSYGLINIDELDKIYDFLWNN